MTTQRLAAHGKLALGDQADRQFAVELQALKLALPAAVPPVRRRFDQRPPRQQLQATGFRQAGDRFQTMPGTGAVDMQREAWQTFCFGRMTQPEIFSDDGKLQGFALEVSAGVQFTDITAVRQAQATCAQFEINLRAGRKPVQGRRQIQRPGQPRQQHPMLRQIGCIQVQRKRFRRATPAALCLQAAVTQRQFQRPAQPGLAVGGDQCVALINAGKRQIALPGQRQAGQTAACQLKAQIPGQLRQHPAIGRKVGVEFGPRQTVDKGRRVKMLQFAAETPVVRLVQQDAAATRKFGLALREQQVRGRQFAAAMIQFGLHAARAVGQRQRRLLRRGIAGKAQAATEPGREQGGVQGVRVEPDDLQISLPLRQRLPFRPKQVDPPVRRPGCVEREAQAVQRQSVRRRLPAQAHVGIRP